MTETTCASITAREAGTITCQVDTEREAQGRVSPEPRQTREVRVWRPKREAYQACVSEAPLPKRDFQQREVCTSPQRHEIRVSTATRGTQKAYVSQASLAKCDNQ